MCVALDMKMVFLYNTIQYIFGKDCDWLEEQFLGEREKEEKKNSKRRDKND